MASHERILELATTLGYVSPRLVVSLGASCSDANHRYRVLLNATNMTGEEEDANTVEVALGFIEATLTKSLASRVREAETEAAKLRAALNGGDPR